MKGTTLLAITTMVLITTVIFSLMDLGFNYIFLLTMLGQCLLIYTVIRVLKEDYQTDKEFDDFYEDTPVERL